jgi:pimeloyl-ACP methyl ester carboxylesterase
MILHSSTVEQTIDRDERALFHKELVIVRAASEPDPSARPKPPRPGSVLPDEGVPLAMIRKRVPRQARTIASVVLVHGYGQNRYAWHLPSRSLFNYLAKAGFDVFNLELRGHGRSRHLGAHPPRHVSTYVEHDLPAAIEEVQRLSGDRPVFLVGHSLGGLVSYATAAKLGRKIAGVATLGSPYQFTKGSLALRAVGSLMLAVDQRVHLGHGALDLKPLSETMRLLRGFIESPIFPLPIRGFAPKSLEPTVLGQHMALAMDVGSVAVMRNMFLSAAEARRGGHCLGELTGYADEFESLDLPLLVVAGTLDDLAPPASVEPAYLRSHSSDKTYRAFPRGHMDLLVGKDCPQTIWPLLLSWLLRRAKRLGRSEVPEIVAG